MCTLENFNWQCAGIAYNNLAGNLLDADAPGPKKITPSKLSLSLSLSLSPLSNAHSAELSNVVHGRCAWSAGSIKRQN